MRIVDNLRIVGPDGKKSDPIRVIRDTEWEFRIMFIIRNPAEANEIAVSEMQSVALMSYLVANLGEKWGYASTVEQLTRSTESQTEEKA